MNVTPWTMNHQLYAIPMKNNWEKWDWEILRFQLSQSLNFKISKSFFAWKLSQNSWRFLLKNRTLVSSTSSAGHWHSLLFIHSIYVEDQYSYDNIKTMQRISIVSLHRYQCLAISIIFDCSPPIAPAMKRDFPEVLQFTRVVTDFNAGKHLLRYKEKLIYEDKPVYVDSTFLMFSPITSQTEMRKTYYRNLIL
jgi:hypothetical protein